MGNDIISKFDVPYGIVVFKLDEYNDSIWNIKF